MGLAEIRNAKAEIERKRGKKRDRGIEQELESLLRRGLRPVRANARHSSTKQHKPDHVGNALWRNGLFAFVTGVAADDQWNLIKYHL